MDEERKYKTYKLLRGVHSYKNASSDIVRATPGDRIPLTDGQAKAFADKVELVGESPPEVATVPTAPESISTAAAVDPGEVLEQLSEPEPEPESDSEVEGTTEVDSEVNAEVETESDSEDETESGE